MMGINFLLLFWIVQELGRGWVSCSLKMVEEPLFLKLFLWKILIDQTHKTCSKASGLICFIIISAKQNLQETSILIPKGMALSVHSGPQFCCSPPTSKDMKAAALLGLFHPWGPLCLLDNPALTSLRG